MLRGRLPRRCCPTRGYRLEARQKCLGLHSKGFSITWQGSRPCFTMKVGIKVAAGCLAPSPKESGLPNETPAVHICRRGDGSAIRAVGRGVPPGRMVGRSLRDRRSGRPRLSRPCGEAALMPLHLVGPARRAGRAGRARRLAEPLGRAVAPRPPLGRATLVAAFRGSGTHAASSGRARLPSGPPVGRGVPPSRSSRRPTVS